MRTSTKYPELTPEEEAHENCVRLWYALQSEDSRDRGWNSQLVSSLRQQYQAAREQYELEFGREFSLH